LFGKRGQRRIVVLHDIWFLSDRYQGAPLTRVLFRILLRLQIRYTHDIITVSEYSKREIVEKLAVEDDRIHVVPNCIGRGLNEFSDGDNGNVSGPGRVKRPYFLLIGSDRVNKNVSRALAAYRRYAAGRIDVPVLFLVGTYSANFVRHESAGLEADREPNLEFKGYVSRGDYIRLLKGAHAVVYPTIYEGFGIPVIEALAAGKRILISKGTVCEELAGNAGIAVDGESVEALANGFALLEEPAARGAPPGAARVPDCESSARLLAEVLQAGV
jgi:alpha-1,3-rhamnosyl/mannosyltransferase